jgi:hypothetical protein
MVVFGEVSRAQRLFKMLKADEPWLDEDGDVLLPDEMHRLSLVNLRLRVVEESMIPFRQLTHLNLSFNRLTEIFGLSHLKSCKSSPHPSVLLSTVLPFVVESSHPLLPDPILHSLQ